MRIIIRLLVVAVLALSVGRSQASFPGSGLYTPPVLSFQTSANNSGGCATGATFSSQAIGAAANNRYVIVAYMAGGGTNTQSATLTIGGVAATRLIQVAGASRGYSGIFIAYLPTGTTASIVSSNSPSLVANRCSIGVWAVYGLTSPTAFGTATGTAQTTNTLTLTVPTRGIGIFAGYDNGDSGTPTPTWTVATQRYNAGIGGDGESGADYTNAGNVLSISPVISWSPTGSNDAATGVSLR